VSSTADRIVDAAFTLFEQRGYEATSVEDIAERAGVSRSTFFRHYGSKESVIFPDHDALLRSIEDRLAASTEQSAIAAVSDAVRIVLFHYVAEGERARQRYRLTSTVPALRERELVSGARYQRLFRRYISEWGDKSDASETRAELMAAAVVAAHNRALRKWLRGESNEPRADVDDALATVQDYFATDPEPQAVLVVRTDADLSRVTAALKRL
jgi:AcrR family transcriptional regulator